METIKIFGHRNPDNDAVMSAVCYAAYKRAVDAEYNYQACALGELPKDSIAVLERWGVEQPVYADPLHEHEDRQKVILTDHNEIGQSIEGIEFAEVVEIIDHHRIADVQTAQPITFINLPVGSTCTVIALMYEYTGVELSQQIAGCLLSAILTDTVILKSPTTTQADHDMVRKLSEQCEVDAIEYGKWLFNARGSSDFTPAEMVSRDCKRFEIADRVVYIGQFETVDKDAALNQTARILEEMDAYRIQGEGDTLVLLITDILEEGSQVFAVGETDLVEKGLEISLTPDGVWMPGVLSRKKQVAAPLIEKNA